MNKAVTNASSTSTLLGHQSRCFDVRFNFDSQLFISSSEDGSSKLWNLQQKKCLNTLIHNKEAEVLRSCFLNKSNSLICTGGSDATAIIWKKEGNKYNKVEKLKHTDESQVYVCESFCHPLNQFTDSLLLTAADNKLYIWDCEGNLQQPYIWTFESTESDPSARFGGARNEQNLAFIFDAKICPLSEDLICVALSDSTIRLVDKREHNHDQHMTLFNYNKLLPGNSQNQSTAVTWSDDGYTILSSTYSGDLNVIDTRTGSLRAVLRSHRSASFGSQFCHPGQANAYINQLRSNNALTPTPPTTTSTTPSTIEMSTSHDVIAGEDRINSRISNSNLTCITWSSDTTIKLWDVQNASGLEQSCVELVKQSNYPIYSAAITSGHRLNPGQTASDASSNGTGPEEENNQASRTVEANPSGLDSSSSSCSNNSVGSSTIVYAGGGNATSSFIGNPMYLATDVFRIREN